MAQTASVLGQRHIASLFTGKADIFLAIIVVSVVALLVVPIPTFLIDILICANICFALCVLLLAVYIPSALRLSSFPTILLLTTLFRLGLNVATSRLILLNADAGEMVLAFGNTVVGGNLVVGIVIFLVLMLINMLVVAKGSERVAEVAARFTLDAMPGKQMSIDADMRAGIIDSDTAKQKREALGRESQLFGAMDGAMKFVKGDVIAGIIIFAINIVAGIIIGKMQLGMELDEALATYAILSVGDGLVSIIPGLLMSVCAGLIVTRVDSNVEGENLGENVASQMLGFPKAFIIGATFIGLIGQMPGLPGIPFTIMSLLTFAIGFMAKRQNSSKIADKSLELAMFEDERPATANPEPKAKGLTPICIEVAANLIPFVDDKSNFITELIPMLRDSLEIELGIDFPGIRVRGAQSHSLKESQYILFLNEIPIEDGFVKTDECLVSALPHELRALGIKDVRSEKNPCSHASASVTNIVHQAILEQAAFMVWDAPSRILLHLSAILRKNAKDFITIHETQVMLDRLETLYPALVKEVVPKAVNLFQLTDILKRLLSEQVAIKDIKTILQTLAEYGPSEQNTVLLTEHVRAALNRYLCYQFGQGHDMLLVYLLSPEIEDMIRSSIEHQKSGSYLALDPEISQDILRTIRHEVNQLPPGAKKPVLLTAQDIRRFVRKLIEFEFFEMAVLSFHELNTDFRVQPIGRISLQLESDGESDATFDKPFDDQFELAPPMM